MICPPKDPDIVRITIKPDRLCRQPAHNIPAKVIAELEILQTDLISLLDQDLRILVEIIPRKSIKLTRHRRHVGISLIPRPLPASLIIGMTGRCPVKQIGIENGIPAKKITKFIKNIKGKPPPPPIKTVP